VSLLVALLGWSGLLATVSRFLKPAMGLVGLPGEAALVLLSSCLLNIYSAIAVAGTLELNLREATILAIMCLTAHNLIVETAVMRKAGSSGRKMALLRLAAAAFAGWLFSRLLPAGLASAPFSAAAAAAERQPFWAMAAAWALSAGRLALKVVAIVLCIMVLQRLLEEFRAMEFLSKAFAPLMRLFGLPEEASFLWIVVNVVGYGYGAGVIVERVGSGKMKRQDADLFNHHAGLCHSLLEDTVLFATVGVPILWITLPRLALAALVVWLERIRRHYIRRSFRVGTR